MDSRQSSGISRQENGTSAFRSPLPTGENPCEEQGTKNEERPHTALTTNIFGLTMSSPILSASGCYGYGKEFSGFYDLGLLGAVVVKGITLNPRAGNPGRRLIETPAGLINSIGLENPGVEGFIATELPFLRERGVPVMVNISGNTPEEYAELAERLDGVLGVAALEVNISCPNVKQGGMAFGASCEMASSVTRIVRERSKLPMVVKLSPNVTDIAAIARSVEAEGADGISLINTLLGMAIDINHKRPFLNNTFGGLSGPAVKPVALRMVWQVAGAVKVPVIGMGGISTWQDAAEFILAGASAVAVGTANFVNPNAVPEIYEGLCAYVKAQGAHSIAELVGAARPKSK